MSAHVQKNLARKNGARKSLARKTLAAGFVLALLSAPAASLASPRTLELYDQLAELTAAPKHGAALYGRYCVSCHGPRAFGDGEKAIPSLAGQLESYLLKELVDYAELDRDAPEMHRLMMRTDLSSPQAWRDLGAYLSHLQPNEHAQAGDGKNVMRGAQAYANFCAMCHGKAAQGMERGTAPALRSQHYSYLVTQLRSFDTDRRLNLEAPLIDHMAGLSRADLEAIADYLSRLLPSNSGPLTVAR